jgi:pimeloyl-ACP methyl ester carboxylesterase/NAD(P)-dependent dehydrogenase (short-subunit alcohol dehydrogenase family)/aryl carrier-like protein
VIALEHADIWGGLVDLDPNATTDEDEAAALLAEIEQPLGEQLLAFRQGQRYVARLAHADDSKAQPVRLQPEATYLISGGMGGLGLKVAYWLVEQGARHLVLMGRSAPSEAARETVEALERAGAEVVIAQADVSQAEQVARVFSNMRTSMPPLRGVVHAAGVLDDGLLLQQDWERFERVLAPKVLGAWNLHALTQLIPLDFFVLFSSAAALFGSPGQGNYAAANAFLDALAHDRQAHGLPAVSINWGPWAEVGMAARLDMNRRWMARGMANLSPQQGIQAFAHVLEQSTTQMAVLPLDWPKFAGTTEYTPSLLADLVAFEPQATIHGEGLVEQFLETQPDQRQDFVQSYLRQQVAHALGMVEMEVPLDGHLLDLGMDSLMVMEVINACKRDMQLMLYPREFYERPSLGALAKYLTTELEQTNDYGEARPATGMQLDGLGFQKVRLASTERQLKSGVKRNPKMIFLLGSPRSGSTLLRVMLAGHPALFCPPELHLLPFTSMAERHRELEQSYLGEGLQRALMELEGIDATASKALIDGWNKQGMPIKEVYARLQQLASPRLLVDKSPTYARSLETLQRAEKLFAEAQYIDLTRHPYAMIESFVRQRMNKIIGASDADPHLLAEQIWLQTNQNVLDFFQQVPPQRQHIVRYEELVSQPEKVASSLCRFLGIPMEQAILKPYEGERMTDGVHTRSLSIGDPNFLTHDKIDPALAEVWKKISLPHPLGQLAGQVAATLGYDLPMERTIQAEEEAIESILSGATSPMREFYLNVRGLSLCMCAWGPEEGPLILFLHGMLDHGAIWEGVAGSLAKKGYYVVAPDQRGHGCSGHLGPGGSYHLLDYVADIDAVLSNRANVTPPLADRSLTLVGHSMGSAVAAMYASARPEKVGALILVESLLPTESADDEAVDQLVTQLNYLVAPPQHPELPDVASAAKRLRRAMPALSEEQALRMANRITEPCNSGVRWRWDPRLLTRAGIMGGLTLKAEKYFELLRRIQAPVTLVYGQEANSQHSLERLLALIPQATSVILAGGHHLHIDAKEALADVIAQVALLVQERKDVLLII